MTTVQLCVNILETMMKKLFTKRLGISLLWALGPIAALGALIWVGKVFGNYVAATITLVLYLSIVLKYLWEDICLYLDQWIDWLKGNDGQPD